MSLLQQRHWTPLRIALCAGFGTLGIGFLAVPTATAQSAAATAPATGSASEFDSPSGLAFNGGDLWVSNLDGNSVTEINPTSGAWVDTYNDSSYQFNQPTAITSSGADLFVANAGGSVTELQASNGALVRVISGSQYDFADPVAIDAVGSTIIVLSAGEPSATPAVPASITEIDAATGDLVVTNSKANLALDDPVALTAINGDVFVPDEGNNSVTEASVATDKLVRVITNPGLGAPDGIASGDGHVWAVDSGPSGVTEIDSATGTVLNTWTDNNGSYGFASPSVAIEPNGAVFIASPFGSSPMITKVGKNGAAKWYMCNTNGPYYFSLPSAFAVSGKDLWVASSSGANNPNQDAATGSLTEMLTSTGALVTTLPQS